jgi:hypothetical protein
MVVPAASEGAGGGDEALLGARHRDLDRIQRERVLHLAEEGATALLSL